MSPFQRERDFLESAGNDLLPGSVMQAIFVQAQFPPRAQKLKDIKYNFHPKVHHKDNITKQITKSTVIIC